MEKLKYSTTLACLFYITLFLLNSLSAFSADTPLTIVSEDKTQIVIEGTANDLTITSSQYLPYKNISIKGYSVINQSGSPAVLVTGQLIEIPEGYDIKVSSYPVETVKYPAFLLGPAPYPIVVEDAQGNETITEQYLPDFDSYAKNAYSPQKLAIIEYTGYLRDKRIARLLCYPVQYNPVTKTLLVHKKYRVELSFRFQGATPPPKSSKQEKVFNKIYQSCILNSKPKQEDGNITNQQMLSQATPLTANASSPFAVKAVIEAEGIYKVSYEDLNALGINLSATTNENLTVENRGQEIAVWRSGSGAFQAGDYILFYGEPFTSLYTKKNVYWIYQGSTNGKSMPIKDGSQFSGYPLQTTFHNLYHGEEDKFYDQRIPSGEGVDYWFWQSLTATAASSASADFAAPISNFNSSNGSFSMKLNLRGKTDTSHQTKAYINGNLIADFTWSGQIELTKEIGSISPTLFNNENNIITVEEIGTTTDTIFVNWFEIYYYDTYVAENDLLKFTGEGSGSFSFEVSNFSDSNISLFDITDPFTVVHITNPQITDSGASYLLKFGDTYTGTRTYYALPATQFKTPPEIILDEASTLKAPRENIDYIIITHELFYDAIGALKEYRTAQGLNAEVAKIQDIYDEFSYGIKDAQAIKDFLTYAYNHWNTSSHPTYVLLVGDASIDYKNNTGNFGNVDLVPTYLFQPWERGDTPTDNWFVCVNGSDPLPDMITGRLCVKTEEDLGNIIEKITAYEAGSAGAWAKKVILAADNDWSDFESISNNLASLLPDTFTAEKVYVRQYSTVEAATTDLVNKISAGSLITNYTGHGNWYNWAGEMLFHTPTESRGETRNDIDRIASNSPLTFLMGLTCFNGYFANVYDKYSLAEDFVRVHDKGAIACLTSTGWGYTYEQSALAEKIFNCLFTDGNSIVGSMVYTAKIYAYNQIHNRRILETYTLFGDPATALKVINTTTTTTIIITTTTINNQDTDHDGVADDQDNCPTVYNPDQADADNDGIGDVCDNCSTVCNTQQLNADGDSLGDVCDDLNNRGCGGCGQPQCEQECVPATTSTTTTSNTSITTTVPPDTDADGIPDIDDNCFTVYNPDQTDTDGDAVGDVCDNCRNALNANQQDSDGDGIGDACDNCPNDFNKAELGICGCGIPDTDTDSDGIADCVDSCPNDPNNDADADGRCADVDNCPTVCNPQQLDADNDGIGDVCDPTSGCGGCGGAECEQQCPQPTTTTTSAPTTTIEPSTTTTVAPSTSIPPVPSCAGVAPAAAEQGATLEVTITGVDTSFAEGTSSASFCTGITVNSITVTSLVQAVANITIAPNAPVGTCDVTVTTGTEAVTCTAAFIITAAPVTTTTSAADSTTTTTM